MDKNNKIYKDNIWMFTFIYNINENSENFRKNMDML